MWRGVGLIVLCLLTCVVGLGQSAITDSDEAYYAEAGREMVASGDWTTPHYNFEPRIQKPVLFYWFIAATYTILGVSEWAARIWSGLAGLGLALVAAAVARRWYDAHVGLLAGLIVASSFGVVPLARQALPDMLLAFLVTVSIWAAIEAVSVEPTVSGERHAGGGSRRSTPQWWLYLSAASCALGMLAKGPVAIALPVTVLAPLLWWQWRRHRHAPTPFPLRPAHVLAAGAIFLLVASPWYLAVMRAQGIGYARQFFIGENVERFATSTYNQWRGWQYIPVIVAGLLPWSAFLLLWKRPMADWLAKRRRLTAPEARLLCWALGPLAFFMLSVGSQPRYILPCLVPLTILLARSMWRHASDSAHAERRGVFFVAALLAAAAMILLGLLLWRATRVLAIPGEPPSVGPAIMTAIGLLTLISLFVVPRRGAPFAIAVGAAAALVVFQSTVLAPRRPEPVEVVAQAVRAEGPGPGLCSCGAFARTLNFYAHRRTEINDVTPEDTSQLRGFLEQPERVLAAVDARALASLEAELGRTFPRLMQVDYLNPSVWQRGEALVRPERAWVQHVVLIANR